MKKIVLIEDDPVSSNLFKSYMGKDFELHIATNTRDGNSLIDRVEPDLVILDYALPDGNAIDVLNHINVSNYEIRALVITKFSNTDVIRKCQKAGAFDFFQKPITKELLLEFIEIALNFTKSHSFKSTEADFSESYRSFDVPFLFETLKQNLGSDEMILREVLKSCLPEFRQLTERLIKASKLPAGLDRKDQYLFCLHRIESMARSIFAEKLRKVVEDVQGSILRGEMVGDSDLNLVSEEVDRVSKSIEGHLRA